MNQRLIPDFVQNALLSSRYVKPRIPPLFIAWPMPRRPHYSPMKKPTSRRRKAQPPVEYFSYQLYQPPHDLFGEVAVTETDLYDWVAAVSPIHLSDRAFDHYVRNYNVAGKVARAKVERQFEAITARRRPPYHARLALHMIC